MLFIKKKIQLKILQILFKIDLNYFLAQVDVILSFGC